MSESSWIPGPQNGMWHVAGVATGAPCRISGQTEPQKTHTQTISRPEVLKQDQALQKHPVLRAHKPDSLQLPPPPTWALPEVLFLPSGQALPSWSVHFRPT